MPRHSDTESSSAFSESPKHKEIAGHSSTTLTNHARNDMSVISGIFRSVHDFMFYLNH